MSFFGKLFGKPKSSEPVFAVAQINDRVMPLERGDMYEDPLHELLQQRGLGEVTGGGTQLTDEKEIEFCAVDLDLKNSAQATLDFVIAALEQLGAPRGSKLIVGEGREIPFGKLEGLAVYINGTDLPDHVYEQCDINVVHEEFSRLLGSAGTIHSHLRGPRETVLNMYGRSFAEMQHLLSGFMATYPLCQNARVVRIA